MYASTVPRSNWLRRASIRLAWYRHMPASSGAWFVGYNKYWISCHGVKSSHMFIVLNIRFEYTYTSSQKPLNKSAMHAVISLLLQSRKFWWYLLLTSSMLLHDVIVTSYCCQRYAVSGNDFVPAGQCTSTLRHARATVELLRQKRQTFLRPTCGLQTAQISVLWITRSGLSCNIMSTTDKSIVWMNWNGGSSMCGAVLNSRFLTRLLTSGEGYWPQRVCIMPATLANTSLFILQGILHFTPADLMYGGRF